MSTNINDAVTIDKLEVPYNPNLLVTYKAIAGTYAAPEAAFDAAELAADEAAELAA